MHATPAKERARRRLPPTTRERLILEVAIQFFAEKGLEASTLELAERAGVTRGLINRYFKTKDDLIKRVYQEVCPLDSSCRRWEAELADRSRPARDRLIEFYVDWIGGEWVATFSRLSNWALLTRPELIQPYADVMFNRIIPLIAQALWQMVEPEHRLTTLTAYDRELANSLHALMRVLRIAPYGPNQKPTDLQALIAFRLDLLVTGLVATVERDRLNGAVRPDLGDSAGLTVGDPAGA